jgi:hypothetical protein
VPCLFITHRYVGALKDAIVNNNVAMAMPSLSYLLQKKYNGAKMCLRHSGQWGNDGEMN